MYINKLITRSIIKFGTKKNMAQSGKHKNLIVGLMVVAVKIIN